MSADADRIADLEKQVADLKAALSATDDARKVASVSESSGISVSYDTAQEAADDAAGRTVAGRGAWAIYGDPASFRFRFRRER